MPGMPGVGHAVAIDTVTAYGPCNVKVQPATYNDRIGTIELSASFDQLGLRGESHLIGKFEITLQPGKRAMGLFRQRYADRLWPIFGFWAVPFAVETALGRLVPRPSDPDVMLRTAEPGLFAIPPYGAWFEKWDSINLVRADDLQGPTMALVEQAGHCLINAGEEPTTPEAYRR